MKTKRTKLERWRKNIAKRVVDPEYEKWLAAERKEIKRLLGLV